MSFRRLDKLNIIYNFLLVISPTILIIFNNYFDKYDIYILLAGLGLAVFIFSWLLKETKQALIKDRYTILQQLFTGNISISIGLAGFLIELILINQLSNIVYFMISNKWGLKEALELFIVFFEIMGVGLLVLKFYDYYIKEQEMLVKEKGREQRRILVLALSKPSENQSNKDLPKNYEPYKDLIDFHKDKLEIIFAIYSEEVKKEGIEIFNKIVENIKPSIEIIKKEADYNNGDSIKWVLISIDRELKEKNIKDEEISIYISSGTNAITVYFTLFGLENKRQIEYMRQDTREITVLNLIKEDVLKFINKIY
ncbi:hypothetical protein [Hydrogenobaculum acidophilum]